MTHLRLSLSRSHLLQAVITLLAAACAVGCAHPPASVSVSDSDSIAAVVRARNEITDEAWEWADSVMSTMSDEEMVGQLFMPAIYARASSANLTQLHNYIRETHVGGIVLLKGDLKSVAIIADTLRRLDNKGVFLAIDAENGLRMRLDDAPEFPWSRDLGRISDDQLLYEFGREIARECRAVGISMVLGPVMDVVPGEAGHGIMRQRSLGSDHRRVADLSIAYARGLEDGGIISVAKHFPGHGSANADSHRALGVINRPTHEVDSIDLYPFKKYSESLLSGIMVGHLAAVSLDSVVRPAIVSPVIMQDLLRTQLGYGGLVLTDALNMEGALGVAGWQAIAAGADIIIAPTDTRREIALTLQALHNNKISEATISHRVRRILFYKYLKGINSCQHIDADAAISQINDNALTMQDSIKSVLHQTEN